MRNCSGPAIGAINTPGAAGVTSLSPTRAIKLPVGWLGIGSTHWAAGRTCAQGIPLPSVPVIAVPFWAVQLPVTSAVMRSPALTLSPADCQPCRASMWAIDALIGAGAAI